MLRRKPLIWDNLHANDYDGRRFFCGPYSGRPPELRGEVSGLLLQSEQRVSAELRARCARFARVPPGRGSWDPRAAYLAAMDEWGRRSRPSAGPPLALEDLVLFGDCFYLPYEEGTEAEAFLDCARGLLRRSPAEWGGDAGEFLRAAARLRELCGALPTLRDRPLFHALSRRVWDLREELDLLERYVTLRFASGSDEVPVHSDFHLPGTFRGGTIARLQELLVARRDGTFAAASGRTRHE